MATQTTAITKSPVMEAINSARSQFEGRLPKGMTVDRFMFGLSTAVQKNPALMQCDPRSVLLAAYEAAELGVSLSPSLQLGWIIPYGKTAQFYLSYRGMLQKAYETGAFTAFFAEVVYAKDKFKQLLAPKRMVEHEPALGDRGAPIGAYANVELRDGHYDFEFLTAEQIERHRKCSKVPDSLMWKTFWEEGWRKTAIRSQFKRLPATTAGMEKLAEVIERQAEAEFEPEPNGALELAPDSTLHELKKAPTPVPSPAPIFVHVDKDFTIVSGNFRPIETELPKVGAKYDGVSRVWTVSAARTHELLKLCDEKSLKYIEVNVDGKPVAEVAST